jgi:hypothetical protein
MEDSKHFQKLRRSSHASDGNDNNEGNNQPLIYYYVPSREVTIVPGHHGDGVEKAATPFPGCHFQFSPFA